MLKRMPLFAKPTTNVSPTDYLRNFWCRYYDRCVEEADQRHSYLSCSLCAYRSVHFDGNGLSGDPAPLPSADPA